MRQDVRDPVFLGLFFPEVFSGLAFVNFFSCPCSAPDLDDNATGDGFCSPTTVANPGLDSKNSSEK